MARTIDQIKSELTAAFMQDTNLADKYGFAVGDDFNTTFSRVSIESLLLYIIAASIWTLEKLFDAHTQEVTDYISAMKPHTLRWYQEKAKAFLYGLPLISGTDQYDTAGMTDEEIQQARVVTFAAVSESDSTLYLKLATTDSTGNPAPLSEDQRTAFAAYLAEYKDAGVRVDVTSVEGDYLRLDLTIYYDPILINANGESKQTGNKPATTACTALHTQNVRLLRFRLTVPFLLHTMLSFTNSLRTLYQLFINSQPSKMYYL